MFPPFPVPNTKNHTVGRGYIFLMPLVAVKTMVPTSDSAVCQSSTDIAIQQ